MIGLISSFLRKYKIYSQLKKVDLTEDQWKYILTFKNEISGSIDAISQDFRYVVFDTETTGMDPKRDKLLSIGAIAIIGNRIILEDSFYKLIHTERDSGKDILVHGILPSESRTGEKLEDVLSDFLKFIDNSILVAHHIDFDLDFINLSLSRLWNMELLNRKIDTAKLAERIDEKIEPGLFIQDRSRYQLDILCKKYNILQFARHHALTDSLSTAVLFLKLQSKWSRMGWNQLKDHIIS